MKALRVTDFAQPPQAVDLAPSADPGPGEVRVRLAATGISFFDLLIASGGYQWKPELPFVPGSEWAGTIEAVGPAAGGAPAAPSAPAAPNWQVGDRVCGTLSIGAWCEQLTLPASALYPVAEGAATEEAAVLLTPYGTALYALRERGQLKAGETVLIGGATGSIGLAALELARVMGARIIATASRPEHTQALRRLGAHAVVDARSPELKQTVKDLAGPNGVDVVLDPIGGSFTDTAFRTLGWGGRLLVVGFAAGGIGALKANLCIVKGASMIGVDLRQLREREPAAARRLLSDVIALHQRGQIRPQVDQVFGFDQADAAFARVRAREGLGRILLKP